jgi:hypothetical protein
MAQIDEAALDRSVALSPIGAVQELDCFEESSFTHEPISCGHHVGSLQPTHRMAAPQEGIGPGDTEATGVGAVVAIVGGAMDLMGNARLRTCRTVWQRPAE